MAIATVVGIVASVASAYAVYSSSQAQANALEYEADLAKQQGEIAAKRAREEASRVRSANIAALGASGASADEGSPLLVLLDNAAQAEYQAQLARYGGRAVARGKKFDARTTRQTGYIQAGSTLLSGALRAYGGFSGGSGGGSIWGMDTQSSGYQSYRAGERGY